MPSFLGSAQGASTFNQPLTLDTSSVTDMSYMFNVRSSHALRTTQPPARTLLVHVTRPLSYACPPFSSRQSAWAFNQPLNFDTSSVTTVYYMFQVRSARGLPPICS